jgi:hypothetical protein
VAAVYERYRASVRERRPDPPPLAVDEIKPVIVGTALFAVAFIVLLPFSATLRADGHMWWLGACAAGFGLGLVGIWHLRRRRRRLAARGISPAGDAQ